MEMQSISVPALVLRIVRFPLVRLVLLGAILFYLYISGHMFRGGMAKGWLQDLAVVAWMVALTLAVYVGFVRVVERRPVSELAPQGLGRELGLGMLLGAGLYTVCILILILLGVYRIAGISNWYVLLAFLWFAVSSSFFEELLFRGVLFRISQDVFGSWAAVLISSLAFGLIHLNNPGATIKGVLFIACGAGVVLAAAYMLTGRLWMSIGFHMAWNYTQAAVFPVHVSGSGTSEALIKGSITGPDLITGGVYGMESSIVSLVVLTTTGVILLVLAARRGKVVQPSWLRVGQ